MTDRFCVAASQFLGRNDSAQGSLLQLSAARRPWQPRGGLWSRSLSLSFSFRRRCRACLWLRSCSSSAMRPTMAAAEGVWTTFGSSCEATAYLRLGAGEGPSGVRVRRQLAVRISDLLRNPAPQESCAPYEHCLVPTQRTCDYDWQPRHRP